LGDTIRLTEYDGKPADVQLSEGATYFLVPVGKTGGESRTFRRFYFSI